MICKRRITRNPILCLLVLCVCIAFITFIKTGNLYFLSAHHNANIKLIENEDSIGQEIKLVRSGLKLDEESQKELARMESMDKKERNIQIDKDTLRKEREEMLRKYNESLIQQEEENDPFKVPKKGNFVDFVNFRTDFKDTDYSPNNLKPVVDDLNRRQLMYNADKFPNLPDNYPVLVIQVHKRVEYFKELLDSLQRTRGIENVILVVSHDFYSDTMNALIRMIKFCKVIQIFFPYSLQINPNEFPGQSDSDCPRDLKKEAALQMGCVNAEHPDKYGHYREAHITMTKHHWWWKINKVFDELDATKKHDGPFIFMEEDHYVAPSFYEALMALHKLKQSDPRCKDSCDILTMGSYNNKENYQFDGSKVLLGNWISSQHNMGMAMYRSSWGKIKNHAKEFCTFDDYNWDWTLLHLSRTYLDTPLTVLVYDVPRMFHVGDCGLHHTKKCANSKNTLNKVKAIIDRNKDFLFTDKVNIFPLNAAIPVVKPNGGWGDVRDHELCLRFVKPDSNLMKR